MTIKILHAGIFNDHELGGDIVLKKGFLQNNCFVEEFDYRTISRKLGIDEMNASLADKAKDFDVLFIGKGELIKENTLKKIRKNGVRTALWYGDIRKGIPDWLKSLLSETDYFFMTSSGETLKYYSKEGKPKFSCFFINPSDPELVEKYAVKRQKKTNILFTGTSYSFASDMRKTVIKYLYRRPDATLYGNPEWNAFQNYWNILVKRKRNFIRGEAYINAILSSKIGIGINAFIDIPKYFSDRLIHYATFGSFFLSYRIPEIDTIFDTQNELIQFHSLEDLKRKIDYYLLNESEREQKALNMQKRVLESYNTKNITRYMLDVFEKEDSNRFPWIEIYKN